MDEERRRDHSHRSANNCSCRSRESKQQKEDDDSRSRAGKAADYSSCKIHGPLMGRKFCEKHLLLFERPSRRNAQRRIDAAVLDYQIPSESQYDRIKASVIIIARNVGIIAI